MATSERSEAGSETREERVDALRGEAFSRHVRFGGYPEVWGGQDPSRVLEELVNALVIRDASDRFRIRYPHEFRKLLGLAARQVGNLINLSEWAQVLEVSRDVVRDYLDILEECHILRLLPVFAGGKRAELTSRPKVFFVDLGLRNLLVDEFRPVDDRVDGGAVLENWVFTELHKRAGLLDSLGFWRTKGGAEVDFVFERRNTLVAIEVKAEAMKRPALSRSARTFIDAYSPARFVVVNRGLRHQEAIGATQIQ